MPLTEDEQYEKNLQEYYTGIHLSNNHRQYVVSNYKGDYLGSCNSIEEALQFRDMYYHSHPDETPRPRTLNLKKNNLHLKHGLEYPLLKRLTPRKKSDYGNGSIRKKGPSSYHIQYSSDYYCSCRTYEQAYYTHKKLQECKWDRKKLPQIQKEYPKWYTWLMEFYRYVNMDQEYYSKQGIKKYRITIPRKYLAEGQNIENITGYSHLEDALFERDWLVKHDWDYESLVYNIDDRENPYYDMELPPFPERKIRNLRERDYHEKELTEIFELIYYEGIIDQREVSKRLNVSDLTIRNWMKFWNTTWNDFLHISQGGENPINVLEKQRIIYQPDLTRPKPANFKGYIQKSNSKKNPFAVIKDNVRYGVYPTKAMAKKVVRKLKACQWDKSQLPAIKESLGYQGVINRGNVYPVNTGGWTIRHKDKNRKMINYGYYKDKRIAELTRDFLKANDWDKEIYPGLRNEAEYIINLVDIIPETMFSGSRNYVIEEYDYSPTKHYYEDNGWFKVCKNINGKLKYFGAYSTEEEAKEIVEVLELNYWDESVLTELKGVIL